MSDWKLTPHVINYQTLALRYLGNGEWFVGLFDKVGQLLKDKKVFFSGDKKELLESLAAKPLRW